MGGGEAGQGGKDKTEGEGEDKKGETENEAGDGHEVQDDVAIEALEGAVTEILEDKVGDKVKDDDKAGAQGKTEPEEQDIEQGEDAIGDEEGACESEADCPSTDPVCSEFGFCQ